MTDCPTYVAPHRNQLGPDGGRYGGFNCTACAAAMVLDQATCGAEKFTGGQIRAATNEPVPDPKSPGLNLEQVDAAIFALTHGRVNLDSRRMYPVERANARIRAGQSAIAQVQRQSLIAMGFGFGNGFAGGHAVKVDAIGGTLHVDDPLTRRFAVTDDQFRRMCGSLLVQQDGPTRPATPIGAGNAYVSFGPDSTAEWRVSLTAGTRFAYYPVNPATRQIIGAPFVVTTGGFEARCTSPARYTRPSGSSLSLVVVLDGFLAIRAAAHHTTYAVRAMHAEQVP